VVRHVDVPNHFKLFEICVNIGIFSGVQKYYIKLKASKIVDVFVHQWCIVCGVSVWCMVYTVGV
jgi:hypothetical protein